MEPNFIRRQFDVPRMDVDNLLAEFQQVFAEVMTDAEARMKLSSEQRAQAELAIEEAMESTRRMVERLTDNLA